MSNRITTPAALLCAALLAGCADRTPVNPQATGDAVAAPGAIERPDRLARMVATALRNPAFRAYLKAQLDASPFAEHKLHFQGFLGASGGRALRYLAEASGETEAAVRAQAGAAIALELYLPVPAHRAAWTGGGDERVLVATAIADPDAPVAFDPRGRRHVLDPETPPETPVIALVPVETDFSAPLPRVMECQDCGGTGGGSTGDGGDGDDSPPPAPPAGLYMTKSHFVRDFEGWLKGAPEFEVHMLGQQGQTDSLISYQCAGERAGGPYFFNQDKLDWSGSVLLFSKQQIDQYNAAHPGQNLRVFVVEDDDTACQIKTDPDRFQKLILAVDSAYSRLTAGNDSSSVVQKAYKFAKAAYRVWQALASWIKSNDELVGNAVEDQIVGAFYPGYNWFVKGEGNVTNGWITLVMY